MSENDELDNESPPAFDFERYREFIAQVYLQNVWLVSAKVTNRNGPKTPENVHVSVTDKATLLLGEGGFHAYASYTVRFKSGSKIVAMIEATYAAEFASDEEITDDLFSTFSTVNLPLNTWPYLREFVSSMLGRMGWAPFTLPAKKINIDPR